MSQTQAGRTPEPSPVVRPALPAPRSLILRSTCASLPARLASAADDPRRQTRPGKNGDVGTAQAATNGRITRSQAAELCQLDPREARQILEKLVKRGELVVRGEKRGSYYERSAEVMSGVQKL